ncbi:MAG: 7-carboxy-7-deazaguanine synthase QueE [Planctomycetia bacterium]|nr:7-carboxy-7-deazaguanine synthase QueE [Planctomycetia bacterium]
MLRVSELFVSYQGEGRLLGTPSVFIRVAGCGLRCVFCDTPYSLKYQDGVPYSTDTLVQEVQRLAEHPKFPPTDAALVPARPRHVVLTGGEPMLFPSVVPLTERLRQAGFHLTIETSGTRFLPVACDWMSISPKFRNSIPPGVDEAAYLRRLDVSRTLPRLTQYPYQIKFVVDTPEDFADVEAFLRKYPFVCREKVYLMPQGTERAELAKKKIWLEVFAKAHGLNVSERAQHFWFREKRGV